MATTYSYGAYPETFPSQLALLSLMAGHAPPRLDGPLQVVEFGCGQGLNLCLQAALHPHAQFTGLDLNRDHVAHARDLAAGSGLRNATFVHADLLTLREQLPAPLEALWGRCDIALAHGLLGWVRPDVGRALQAAAAAALRPGGLLFLSYNCLPGWLPMQPFQHALLALQRRSGGPGVALDHTRELFSQLGNRGSRLFMAQPALAPRLQQLADRNRDYLVHEYCHEGWQPLYADQVIESCAEQGLAYLGAADLPEFFQTLLPPDFQELIRQQPDLAMQQLVRDLLVNQAFRRDVYANGRVPLWQGDAQRALGEVQLISLDDATASAPDAAFAFSVGNGTQVQANADKCRSMLQRLQHGPATIETLRRLSDPHEQLADLLPILCLLLQSAKLAIVPPAADPGPSQQFNRFVLARIASGAPYRWLAAPGLGLPLRLDQLSLLTLHAIQAGHSGAQLLPVVQENLARLGRHDDPEGGLAHRVERCERDELPRLLALGVLDPARFGTAAAG